MIEARVKISAAYPGSPTSEIGVRLAEIANESGIYFEFSTNEKVAIELAASAAIAGAPATVFMKSVGLNVAADSFVQLSMFTMPEGLVVILGDDPGPHSSQNEQDNRYYTRITHIPMLEPANVQEAKDFVVFAMEYAQQWKMPVVMAWLNEEEWSSQIWQSVTILQNRHSVPSEKQTVSLHWRP